MSVEEIGTAPVASGGPDRQGVVVALDEDTVPSPRPRQITPRELRLAAAVTGLVVAAAAAGEWRERRDERAARTVVSVSAEPGAGRSYATFRFDGSGDVTLRARVTNHGPRPVQVTALTARAAGYRAGDPRRPVTVAPGETAAVSVRLVPDCASFRPGVGEEVTATVRPAEGVDVVVALPEAETGYLTSLGRQLCTQGGRDWAPARGQAPGYIGG